MRTALIVASVAALGLTAPALGQPVSPLPEQAQPPGSPKADQAKTNAEAEAALAMTIRMRKEQDERIARIACAAGDRSKCPQPEKAATTAKTPSP